MANPTGNAAIDAVIANVAAEDTVVDSAIVFINGVPKLITDAVAAAVANGATAAQLAPLTDLATGLTTKTAALKAALMANTPPA